MDYALAKELKDAGFAQGGDGLSLPKLAPDGGDYSPEALAYAPTLDELIEACGDFFEGVTTMVVGEKWRATAINKSGRGTTPTEAVARLWLALNKK